MRNALIDKSSNVVANVIVLDDDSDWPVPDGYEVVASEFADIGDIYDGKEFIRKDPK